MTVKTFTPNQWENHITLIDKARLDNGERQYLLVAGIQQLDALPAEPGEQNICMVGGVLYFYTGSAWTTIETQEHKGAASGYAPLNASSKVPLANLATGNGSDTLPLLKGTIADGYVLAYSSSLGGFIGKSISGIYVYKGSVATYADLPSSGQSVGDTYNVVAAYGNYPPGTNWAWNGTAWDPLGGSVDLSAYLLSATAASTYQTLANLTTSLSSASTDAQYPSAKAVYTALPTIALNGTATTTPSFYAPIDAGTSSYILQSSGSGAPTWLNGATKFVDLASAQTITGQKTFAQGPIISSGSLIQTYSPIRISATPAVLYVQNTSFTQGTNPSSELSDYTSLFQDSAGTITGFISHNYAIEGTGYFRLYTLNNAGTLSANLQLLAHSTSTELNCDCTIANFSGTVTCSSPSASSNDSAVPNTSWVCTKLSNICTNIHAKFSTGYISAGSVSYTRIGLKGGICTLSFALTGSSSETAVFANLSEICANLGVTFANPASVQYTGFWFYQDGDSHADRYGYGTVCVIDTSGNLALARVYTTGGAVGTWELSNIGTGCQLFVQFPVNEA